MSLCFACIAPHGDVDLAPELREAMEELGRRFAAAHPDVAVVVTPHSVHVDGHFAVVTAGKVGEWQTDAESARALLAAAEYDGRLQGILGFDRLDFLPLAQLVEEAKADSLWELLVLQGAVGEAARADVLAYAAPTYYGMLVAEIQTAA